MNKLFKYDDVECGGFELVEFFNDVGEKFVFMKSFDFGGSLCDVSLLWGVVGNEDKKFVEECENKIEEEV
ncbi:MAG: hypothetical protein CMG80_04115 [Marinobacter sp.]|nr:hypothetical protein [Marinobacter sp.]|tara:strand:+ start:209 stop:418 length:210 start_codon:yes stop_codon:yes gene_type:complete